MKMYTIDGIEVELVKKIDEGYLAKQIYYTHDWEDDYDEEAETICNNIQFYEKLFEKCPSEKYTKEVIDLKKEADNLREDISNLQQAKRNETDLLSVINKFPILSILAQYLTKDFSYVVYYDRYEIYKKEQTYLSSHVKVVYGRDGWGIYKLRREGSESYDDTPFSVFRTMNEVIDFCRERLIKYLYTYKTQQYASSKNIKEYHDKIHYDNPIKKDEKYLEVYDSIYNYLVEEEKKKQAEKLKKEIEEFEGKKKQLENLQTTN